jgi:hypothetical protein
MRGERVVKQFFFYRLPVEPAMVHSRQGQPGPSDERNLPVRPLRQSRQATSRALSQTFAPPAIPLPSADFVLVRR